MAPRRRLDNPPPASTLDDEEEYRSEEHGERGPPTKENATLPDQEAGSAPERTLTAAIAEKLASESGSKRASEVEQAPGQSKKKRKKRSSGTTIVAATPAPKSVEDEREGKCLTEKTNDGLVNDTGDGSGSKKKVKRSKSRTSHKNTGDPKVEETRKQEHYDVASDGGVKAPSTDLKAGGDGVNTWSHGTRVDPKPGQTDGSKTNGGANGDTEAKKADAVAAEESVNNVEEFWGRYPYLREYLKFRNALEMLGFDGSFCYEKVRLIGNEKARELNETWKKLKLEGDELQIKKLGLVMEMMKLTLDALK